MQIPFLHQQIILETERLRDMHRSMMMHNSAIPSSEMEAFLKQLRKLYEVSLQLGSENSLQLLNEVHLAHAMSAANNATESFTKSPIGVWNEDPVSNQLATDHPSSPSKTANHSEYESQAKKDHAAVQSTNATISHEPDARVIAQTVARKFAEPSTIADKIAGADSHKRLSENLKLPVSDINAAIGINEKFQFINQLFHGDSQKYTQFVNELNNCPSADAARKSINQVSELNHWESIPAAKHFIDVIERKFLA